MKRSVLFSAVGFLVLLGVVDCGKTKQSASEAAGEAMQFNEADLVDEPPNPADELPYADIYFVCNDTLILIRESENRESMTIHDYDKGSLKFVEKLASGYLPKSDYAFHVGFPGWKLTCYGHVVLIDENRKAHLFSLWHKEAGSTFWGGGRMYARDLEVPYYGREVGFGGRYEIAYVSYKDGEIKLANGFKGRKVRTGFDPPTHDFKLLVTEISKLARFTELGQPREEWRLINTTVIHTFAPATDTLDYLCTNREGLYTLLQDLKMKLVPTDFTFLYALERDSLRSGQVSQ